ncbi:hypothetical protein B0T10DRAFT_400799 [Thelonectria olida]|uniref:Duf1665 domain containing protein n=1 Tax=Thelonectria olida TaxID=1576542 RepID=A0A9P8WAE5_9HYPO|nr:hypothetical protein B0T10DRAFT_400799 [Thelonectria olida]
MSASDSNQSSDDALCVPGFGKPVDFDVQGCFPVLVGDQAWDWNADTLTVREVCMLRFIEDITNKPEWWRKVKNRKIVAKWKKEALEMPWTEYREYADFTEAMADACIMELRKKAKLYKTGLIPVMDYSACAIKSDKLIPDDLREALKSAVAPLENVPPEYQDWHPGSKGKVLDLVHPSLYPLVYGRSLIIPDKRITIENCLEHCGLGVAIPEPTKGKGKKSIYRYYGPPFSGPVETASTRFQWLPCDVDLTGEHPRIESYINNLHPVEHAALYPIIEQIIEKSLPAWDVVYRWPTEFLVQRISARAEEVALRCTVEDICFGDADWDECDALNRPVNEDEQPRGANEHCENWYEGSERQRLDIEWFRKTHPIDLPGPSENPDDYVLLSAGDVKRSGFFDKASRIQVIVKLANIHLTPESPSYDGGSWHIEGQLNERICATALYYYDSDNITECHLDFRTAANAEYLSANFRYQGTTEDMMQRIFAIRPDADTIQDIGSVLTRPDRMLFFPNVYQHHVSPFELVDKTRPGHRKILALFLVDPAVPIISTANVPPQQLDWWADKALKGTSIGNLPVEVRDVVTDNLEFPISEREAKKIREELMEERSAKQHTTTDNLRKVGWNWNFCEH